MLVLNFESVDLSFGSGKLTGEDFKPSSVPPSPSPIERISRELVDAHTYIDGEVTAPEFVKIDPPAERIWMSSLKDVPIASDKFDDRSTDVSFYRRNDELVQIVKIRNCAIIFFIKDSIIEGTVILTKRGAKGIEIEYSKNTKVKKDSIGKDMILTVLTNYYIFALEGKITELYGEVVCVGGKFNFGSYITLIRAGFVPIRRSGGDGIRFVFQNSDDGSLIHSIMSAYDNYQKSSEKHLKAMVICQELVAKSIGVSILGDDLTESLADGRKEAKQNEEMLLNEKLERAKLFETACLECASSE